MKMNNKNIFFAGSMALVLCMYACGDNIASTSDSNSAIESGTSTIPEAGMPTELMCGNVPYNPTEKVCAGYVNDANNEPMPLLLYLCGNLIYNPIDTTGQNVVTKLAHALLFESKQICRDGVVYGLCGEDEYDIRTKFCYEHKIYDLCDGQRYAPDGQVCDNGKVRGVCGDNKIVYDFESQTCRGGKIYNWCGNVRYDPETQGCLEQDSTIYTNP